MSIIMTKSHALELAREQIEGPAEQNQHQTNTVRALLIFVLVFFKMQI